MSEDSAAPATLPPATQTSSGLPGELQYSRYAILGKKSPFTLASSTEEAADFAKDLVLAGFVRMNGKDFVMVANKTKQDRVLVGKEASSSSHGMVLLEVKKDPSGDPAKMEAKVKKGAEVATLKYEVTGGGGGTPVPAGAGGQPVAAVPGVPIPSQPGQVQPSQVGGQQAQKLPPGFIRSRRMPIVPNANR